MTWGRSRRGWQRRDRATRADGSTRHQSEQSHNPRALPHQSPRASVEGSRERHPSGERPRDFSIELGNRHSDPPRRHRQTESIRPRATRGRVDLSHAALQPGSSPHLVPDTPATGCRIEFNGSVQPAASDPSSSLVTPSAAPGWVAHIARSSGIEIGGTPDLVGGTMPPFLRPPLSSPSLLLPPQAGRESHSSCSPRKRSLWQDALHIFKRTHPSRASISATPERSDTRSMAIHARRG